MNNKRLAYLLEQHFTAELTFEEEQELLEHMTNDPGEESQALFANYYEKYKKPILLTSPKKNAIWKGIQQEIGVGVNRWQIALRIAAAIILFFSILAGGYFHLKINKQRELSASQIYLKKDRGSVYILNDSQQGPIAMDDVTLEQYGIQVDSSGTLIFQQGDPVSERSMQSNLVIMSNQAQVQCVILEDGSKVWLNSNSTLTVPRHFTGLNRSVVLNGEAYFEVVKMPSRLFQVKAGPFLTEVLGTHFTVNFSDQQDAKVTLVEGRVRVSNDKESLILSPGQQAIGDSHKMDRQVVDMMDLLSWKEGYFKFDNASVLEILNQIKDWYDVQYIRIETDNSERFTGTYKRTNKLDDLLRNLEEVSNITFKIKEGGIHVVKK